jgi:chemotaxis protein MotB
VVAGCAENSMVLKGKVAEYEKQQTAMTRQYQQLQDRATALDRDNQEYGTLLAQSKQQTKVAEDQLALLREQLRTTTAQLAQVKADKESSDKNVQHLTASMQRQNGVKIPANNSFLQTMPAINIPGIVVRRDGDVIRVEVPSQSTFETGTAKLRPGAENLIADVAAEIARTYPEQMIGVEGYLDNDPTAQNQLADNHELTVARAYTVYHVLVTRTKLQGKQLIVVGHGSNQPVCSNGSPEGKERNRRVELVIYPEKKTP